MRCGRNKKEENTRCINLHTDSRGSEPIKITGLFPSGIGKPSTDLHYNSGVQPTLIPMWL